MDVVDYIISECDRQHTKNYGDFAIALDWAITIQNDSDFFRWCGNKVDMMKIVSHLGYLVEPERNNSKDGFRNSHVGFLHGGNAAPVNEVRSRMERWANNANSIVNNFYGCSDDDANALVKSFLDIHPFEDGNGRGWFYSLEPVYWQPGESGTTSLLLRQCINRTYVLFGIPSLVTKSRFDS